MRVSVRKWMHRHGIVSKKGWWSGSLPSLSISVCGGDCRIRLSSMRSSKVSNCFAYSVVKNKDGRFRTYHHTAWMAYVKIDPLLPVMSPQRRRRLAIAIRKRGGLGEKKKGWC